MTVTFRERVHVFGRDRTLVGITCQPREPLQRPPVIFLNSGIIHRVGANRLYVRLARALADRGVASLRFDLSGIGDSLVPSTSQGRSPQEQTVVDMDDALDFARDQFGDDGVILTGLCSGADNALRAMRIRDDVVGVALLDLNAHPTPGFWLRHIARRAVSPGAWGRLIRRMAGGSGDDSDSPAVEGLLPDAVLPPELMREHFGYINARGGRFLCVFTGGLPYQFNHRRQFFEMLPGVVFGERLELHYLAEADHTFSRRKHQETLERTMLDWVSNTSFPSPAG